ncbi:MAG: molybdopterin-dependent oxidoreductase [Dehalococcoidia bacterium]|nr:molybdopterin-dependent oxidoreductase [Dehalococcoidia bacterium]MDW8119954.1 molybdopterin-dependent oxidoreductase [Chloroflexota bacterium]
MPDTLTLTIDGKQVTARPGQTILQVALDNGIYIPYLCYFPGMKPWGACRMCVVEVEGGRGTPASCTTPVADKMVVKTNSPLLQSLRQGILELLLSEHPHGCLTCHRIELCGPTDVCLRHIRVTDRCVVCPKNERCELKDTVRFVGVPMETPLPYNYRNLPIEVRDPFYDRDYNLCIVCARCVRACEELRGDNAICMVERSGTALVGTSRGTSLLESGCEFCGACIDVCPVGALVERAWKWEKAVSTTFTTCPNCPVGCQMKVEVDRKGRLIRAIGDWNAFNGGMLCYKGKFGLEFVNAPSALRTPLMRQDGHLREASWEEALDYTAQRLAGYKGSYAVLLGLRATTEDAYLAQKFARLVMASNAIDAAYPTRPFLRTPLEEALGAYAATGSLSALKDARAVLVVNSNITEEHNVAAVPIKRAKKAGTAQVVVLDPREVELTRYADLWLRPFPGTEHLVVGALVRLLLEEGLAPKDGANLEGLDALRQSLQAFAPDAVALRSGVPLDALRKAVRLLGGVRPLAILYSLDNLPPAHGEAVARALVNLALLTGNEGWLFPLPPGTNLQGLLDVGAVAGYLPGHARLGDATARQRLAQMWGAEVPSAPAVDFPGILAGIASKRVRAVQIVGNSPALDTPAVNALAAAEFIVVHDHLLSPLARVADVVFPSATFAQRDGSYTSLERRVQRVRGAVPLRGQERPDWWVFSALAQRMGGAGFAFGSWEEVWREMASAVPAYADLGPGRLGGVWPLTPQRTRLLPLPALDPADVRTPEFPLALAVGRVLLQEGREMHIVRRGRLNTIQRDEVVEVHPADAQRLGLSDGAMVDVVTPQGRQRARVQTSGTVPGMVSITGLFGQLAVQLASSEAPDPMLAVPGLSVLPARLEPVA